MDSLSAVREQPFCAPGRGWLPRNLFRGTPLILGLVLLGAASLKGQQWATALALGTDSWGTSWASASVVACELLLGVWLLVGVFPQAARAVALAAFAGFLGVSVVRAALGEASCGCFGTVAVSPWLTGAFDLGALVALWRWRPPSQPLTGARPITFAACAFAVAAIALLGVAAARRHAPAGLTEDGAIVGDSDTVGFEPAEWVGKRFPLVRHIDVGSELAFGHWIVVLYHRRCRVCRKEVDAYEQWARQPGARVALIEVPEVGESGRDKGGAGSHCLRGRLSGVRRWWVRTPVVLRLEQGFQREVIRAGGG